MWNLLLLSSTSLLAQSPVRQWDKTFGGNHYDELRSMVPTADGGYLLAGSSWSGIGAEKSDTNRGGPDYWIIKVTKDGSKQWDKTYGGTGEDRLEHILPTIDGGYLLAGSSSSGKGGEKSDGNRGENDYWIVKITKDGAKQWDKTFGGNSQDFLTAIVPTSDGGYLLGGQSSSDSGAEKSDGNRGDFDYWIVKVTKDGSKQWDKTYGGTGGDAPYSMVSSLTGGYLLGGSSSSGIGNEKSESNRGSLDYWIIKISDNGVKEWDKTIGASDWDLLLTMLPTWDGGYLLGGYSTSNAGGEKSESNRGQASFTGDQWIVKVSSDGTKQWDKTFGGSEHDELRCMIPTIDGGYLLGGPSWSGIGGEKTDINKGGPDYWIIKVTRDGVKQWDKTFGGSEDDRVFSILPTPDGNYLLGGSSYSGISGDRSTANRGESDFWLVQTTVDPIYSFHRTINFNGPSVRIDGKIFQSSNSVKNFSYTGYSFSNQAVPLLPPTDSDRATMIRSSLWGNSDKPLTINIGDIPKGAYQIYLYVWEDNASEFFEIYLENKLVERYSSGEAGSWKRLGPYSVTVTDGTLNLGSVGGAANFSGIEIYQVSPSLPATPSQLKAVASAPFQVNLSWKDNAIDETAYVVEYAESANGPFRELFPSSATILFPGTLAANTTSFAAFSQANTQICYRVRAVRQTVSSAYSNIVCATPPASLEQVGSWQGKSSVAGGNVSGTRTQAVGFSINGKGYVATGFDHLFSPHLKNDLWEYDPITNNWTRKADFPGGMRFAAVGFSVNGKAYLGLGIDSSGNRRKDWWEYNPLTNSWTRKADFPGQARSMAVGFTLTGKGYLGMGYSGSVYLKDFWMYDDQSDRWIQKADFGGQAGALPTNPSNELSFGRVAVGFVIGDKGYINTTTQLSSQHYGEHAATSEFYQYDPLTNYWTRRNSIIIGAGAAGFSIGDKGYMGIGSPNPSFVTPSGNFSRLFYQYDPQKDLWFEDASFPQGLSDAATFVINNTGYMATGFNYATMNTPAVYAFTPAQLPSTLYRAINLNGPAVVIDGKNFESSQNAANFSFSGNTFINQSVTLQPDTDANRASMIRSSIWGNSAGPDLKINLLNVTPATYQLYLYTWEDNVSQTFDIYLEGNKVESAYSSGTAGSWKKLGPYLTTVTDGTLTLSASGGDANFSGIEVYKVSSSARLAASLPEHDNSGLSIYPNPAINQNTRIQAQGFLPYETITVSVYDLRGKRVHHSLRKVDSTGNVDTDLHMLGMGSGLYVLMVTGKQTVQKAKLVINY
ncbi:T9SS type A sorting domain-containing protein [Xanthocytophaga agilis]|uniref:T9SS type A sorting domain-containing protein n=1 Tax=Xanthocytophaga agilis TaxID=3048010 RepID=UPI0028D0EAED|nr:T9SS type A sorting domain-containing protein [Xanthocytophaga agilis]